jgi:hypothetical protein
MDSLMNANQGEEPKVVNTGQKSTVAGISCEEWEVSAMVPSDSAPFGDKIKLCLAESVPALRAFTSLFEKYMPDLGVDFGEMKQLGKLSSNWSRAATRLLMLRSSRCPMACSRSRSRCSRP